MIMRFVFVLVGLTALLSGCASSDSNSNTTGSGEKQWKVAFVTNNTSNFWTIAPRGVEKADSELTDVTADFRLNSDGSAAEQKRVVDDLLVRGVDGIAISPVDPENQTGLINDAAQKALIFTQDSDAPKSERTVYIGTDNVAAGRQAGDLIKQALPGGGKVMLFVGKLDARNAQERIQGIKEALTGTRVEVVDTRTDDGESGRAKSNAADALVKHPDIKALVGLWGYSGPAILSAVKDAKKLGQVKIVAFDEQDETLTGIKDGWIHATVVQQPYEFGYQAITLMAQVLKGDKSLIPENKQIIIPTLVVNKANVEEFTKKIHELRGR